MSHFSYHRQRSSHEFEAEERYDRPARVRTTGTSSFRRRMTGRDEGPAERHASAAAERPMSTRSPAHRAPKSFEELAISRSKPIRWRERDPDRDALVTRLISPPSSAASSEVAGPSAATYLPPSSPPWKTEAQITSANISEAQINIAKGRSPEPRRRKRAANSPPASPDLPPSRPESPDSPDSPYYSSPNDRSSLRTPAFAEFVKVMTAHTPKHILERPLMEFDITPFQENGWFPKGHRYHPKTPPKGEQMTGDLVSGAASSEEELEDSDVGRPANSSPTPARKTRSRREEPYLSENRRLPDDDVALSSLKERSNRFKKAEVSVTKDLKENINPRAEDVSDYKNSQDRQSKSRRAEARRPQNANALIVPTDRVSQTEIPAPEKDRDTGRPEESKPTKPWGRARKEDAPKIEISKPQEPISSNPAPQKEHLETFEEFIERATTSTSSDEGKIVRPTIPPADLASTNEKSHPESRWKDKKKSASANLAKQEPMSSQTNYLEAMDIRLNLGLSHIKDAKRGMDQLNRAIEILPDAPSSNPQQTSTKASEASPPGSINIQLTLPRLWTRDPSKNLGIRFTWLGFILAVVLAWYVTESVTCEIWCHPKYSTTGIWKMTDPFFPWAIPTKLDQWTGGWGRWGWRAGREWWKERGGRAGRMRRGSGLEERVRLYY